MSGPAGANAQTSEQLVKGATDTGNVLNYGMGYNLQRFSPLTQINKDNAKNLVPVWNYSLDNDRGRGIAADRLPRRHLRHHPQRHDGGRRSDRQADLEDQARVLPEDAVDRLLRHRQPRRAIYNGKLFRTTLDAQVVALDAKTGKELWRQKAADYQGRLLA